MKLDFYPEIRLNSTLRFIIFYRWEQTTTRHAGGLNFSTIDPPKAKARQRINFVVGNVSLQGPRFENNW